ncbi:MAG: cyclopropane-fatty-acyl-phospholipid synthase [Planctomycetota bacterium]|nr:cyclopropane-fatty-acyl-phospholipid synthase [Planctomycetota bacterium]
MNSTLKTKGQARLPERLIRKRFEGLLRGRLTVTQDGASLHYGPGGGSGPEATVMVHDARFWDVLLRRGNLGAGESFAQGLWSSPNPSDVVRVMVRNEEIMQSMDGGLAVLSKPLLSAYHLLRRNTQAGSRSNISAHYDLSNEFFGLFLDPTMTYSCGYFESVDSTMEEASIAKMERACRKLELKASDHLLEIGTGWGSMALHAAKNFGCRVTTTTISKEQYSLAVRRVAEAGLSDRVTVLLEDYRKLGGQYDKLVSVEMIEAIGHQYFDEYFATCARLLKPTGIMCLQSITIADPYYEQARRSVDFIKRYIFPGCCIPSVGALIHSSSEASDLKAVHMEDIGPHYARTLSIWRSNLRSHWAEAQELGFDEDFLRLWEFYFAYCEGGFDERRLGDVQIVFARPDARPQGLEPTPFV